MIIVTSQDDYTSSDWISKLFWFSLNLAHENRHKAIIDCQAPVILQLGEDKMLIIQLNMDADQIPQTF